jgi:hypothetical protein
MKTLTETPAVSTLIPRNVSLPVQLEVRYEGRDSAARFAAFHEHVMRVADKPRVFQSSSLQDGGNDGDDGGDGDGDGDGDGADGDDDGVDDLF